MKSIFLLISLIFSSVSLAELPAKAYVPFVKPIDQELLVKNGKPRFEGCGPVAMAMLMSYWHREKGYRMMNSSDHYDGTKHPTDTIKLLYQLARAKTHRDKKAMHTDRKKYKLSFTLRKEMVHAFDAIVATLKHSQPELPVLNVNIMRQIRLWKNKRHQLKKALSKGYPVILVLKKIPGCMKESDKFDRGRHYIVATGYDETNKTFKIINGWGELPAWTSLSASVHKRRNQPNFDGAHVSCRYEEFKNADPSLIWLSQKGN